MAQGHKVTYFYLFFHYFPDYSDITNTQFLGDFFFFFFFIPYSKSGFVDKEMSTYFVGQDH